MKFLTKTLMGMSLLLSSLAIAGQQAPDCGTSLETFNVGTHIGVPPFESLDSAEKVEGFDVKVACELRKRLGYNNIVFVNTPQSSFLPNLNTGVVTVNVSALNEINSTSLQSAAYVKYSNATQGLLFNGSVPAGTTPQNALTLLNANNGAVAVLTGSAEQSILGESFPNIEIQQFSTVAEAVAAVKNVVVDAFYSLDAVVNNQASQDNTVAALNNVSIPANSSFIPQGLGIQIHPTCCQLYVNIKQAIADMEADGTLEKLRVEFKTGPFTPADFTPAACIDTEPDLPKRNEISNFIFDKYCPCYTDNTCQR